MVAKRAPWQRSALLFCLGSLASFVANLTFTVWAVTKPGSNIQNGVGVLTDATSCSRAKKMNAGIHVLINLFSAILLAGSNYCMQILSAPTREQIDIAHRQSEWVEVGVQSIRNMIYTASWGNVFLWIFLLFSSLPLHLFYNSAIFNSISVNEYNVTIVPSLFLTLHNLTGLPAEFHTPRLAALRDAALSGILVRLDRDACLDAYAADFQSSYGDLLLLTPDPPAEEQIPIPLVYEATAYSRSGIQQSYLWMCLDNELDNIFRDMWSCQDKKIPEYRANPTRWQPFNRGGVAECYSLPTKERCRLLFSPLLCWLVAGLNLVKGVLMLATVLKSDKVEQRPLLTIGDAVSSFLRVPDWPTVDMCLMSKDEIETKKKTNIWSREPRMVDTRRRPKLDAVKLWALLACIILYSMAIFTCATLFILGYIYLTNSRNNFQPVISLGLGTLNTETIIQFDEMTGNFDNLLRNIIMANSPQIIASTLYFFYNGFFTSLSLATEWDTYARHRKGLRVSANPVGAQRTTYFLQLPYRYSLPLLTVSGVLHWLISQSIFLIFIELYRDWVTGSGTGGRTISVNGDAPVMGATTCGWSPVGIISVIAVGVAMIVMLVIYGSRRLGSCMPIVGSCSAAIAAACHLVPYKETACEEPLQWGATVHEQFGRAGHCSFSSSEVEPPRPGTMYQ